MYCKKCSNLLKDNDKFCTNCGEAIVIENNESVNEDIFHKFNKNFSVSFLIFLTAAAIFIYCSTQENSGGLTGLLAAIWYIPFSIISIIFTGLNISEVSRLKKKISKLPAGVKVLFTIQIITSLLPVAFLFILLLLMVYVV